MADKIFVDGMRFYRPREGAPSFIKGQVSIDVEQFKEFLKKHQGPKYLNIDLKLSSGGNLYFELNTYKKKEEAPKEQVQEEIAPSEIPF